VRPAGHPAAGRQCAHSAEGEHPFRFKPNTKPGLYTVQLQPEASAYYRVTWRGVVTSSTRYVAVK